MIKHKQKGQKGSTRSTLIIGVVLLLLAGWNYWSKERAKANLELDRDAHITYSKHAKCRMNCRHIDRSEVQEVLKEGKVNPHKSRPRKGTIALEGETHDGQDVRVVFAPESDDRVHVVTVIDLGNEWDCDCD